MTEKQFIKILELTFNRLFDERLKDLPTKEDLKVFATKDDLKGLEDRIMLKFEDYPTTKDCKYTFERLFESLEIINNDIIEMEKSLNAHDFRLDNLNDRMLARS